MDNSKKVEYLRSPEGFKNYISGMFDKLKEQFLAKNKQYGDIDPLGNFKLGAMLEHGSDSVEAMYEVLKGYENKHVVHVYGHSVSGPKVDESLKDIAVYSVIALYMNELYYAEKLAEMDKEEGVENG